MKEDGWNKCMMIFDYIRSNLEHDQRVQYLEMLLAMLVVPINHL